jgi:hypothetical protein
MFDAARKARSIRLRINSPRICFTRSQNNSVVTQSRAGNHVRVYHCMVMNMKHLIASMMLTISLFAAAHADTRAPLSEAVLATAVAQAQDTVIKGVTWRCEETKCTGPAWSGVDSFIKRCSTLSAAIGPLASFRMGGRTTDKSEIATCNRLGGKS